MPSNNNNIYPASVVNRTPRYVLKEDGINISKIIFPHDVQFGLLSDSDNFSNILVMGTISGSIHKTKDGISYLAAGENIDIVSGSLGTEQIIIAVKEDIVATTLSGSLTRLSDGKSYLVAGSNVTITSASNGQVTIASTAGGSATTTTGSFNVKNPAGRPSTFVTTSSLAITGPGGGFNNDISTYGADLYFYVSGSVGSAETAIQGASMFGGDLIISGALHVTENILPNSTPSDGQVIAWNNTTKKLYWKTAMIGFAFASSLSQFTTSETSMTAFAASNAFDPITNGTTVVGSVAST